MTRYWAKGTLAERENYSENLPKTPGNQPFVLKVKLTPNQAFPRVLLKSAGKHPRAILYLFA